MPGVPPARASMSMSKQRVQGLSGPSRSMSRHQGLSVEAAMMVGHDVEHEAQAVPAQRLGQRAERRLAAQLGVELVGVGDIVAVGRALPRAERGREIEVADAELGEIGHQRLGLLEGHAGAQLEPVGGGELEPCGRSSASTRRRAAAALSVVRSSIAAAAAAAPVGVALDRARQVRLLDLVQRDPRAGRRPGRRACGPGTGAGRARTGSGGSLGVKVDRLLQETSLAQGLAQSAAVLVPRALLGGSTGVVEDAEAAPPVRRPAPASSRARWADRGSRSRPGPASG